MKRRDLVEVIEMLILNGQAVVDNWSEGDLAGAVNGLEEALKAGREVLAWWESDE